MKKSGLINIKYQYWLLVLPFSILWVSLLAGINIIYSRSEMLWIKFLFCVVLPCSVSFIFLRDLLNLESIRIGSYLFYSVFSLLIIKIQGQELEFSKQKNEEYKSKEAWYRKLDFYCVVSGILGMAFIKMIYLFPILSWFLLCLYISTLALTIRLILKQKEWLYFGFIVVMNIVYISYLVA